MRIHMMTFSLLRGRRSEKRAFWFNASAAIRSELQGMIDEYIAQSDSTLKAPHKVYIQVGQRDVLFVDWYTNVVHITQLSEPVETSNSAINRLQTLLNEDEKVGELTLGRHTKVAFISENIQKRAEDRKNNAERYLLRLRVRRALFGLKDLWSQMWFRKNRAT